MPLGFVYTKPTTNIHLQKKTNLKQCLDSAVMLIAAQLDPGLRLLDKYAPMNKCKVSDQKCAPWYDNISDTLRAAKISRRKAERRWCSSGLTIDKKIYDSTKSCNNNCSQCKMCILLC